MQSAIGPLLRRLSCHILLTLAVPARTFVIFWALYSAHAAAFSLFNQPLGLRSAAAVFPQSVLRLPQQSTSSHHGFVAAGAPSTPSSSSAPSPTHFGRDRLIVRRTYRRQCPPTELCGVGNILSDAVHSERWRFFTPHDDGEGTAGGSVTTISGERGRFCTQPDDGESTAGGSSSPHASSSSSDGVAADGGERGCFCTHPDDGEGTPGCSIPQLRGRHWPARQYHLRGHPGPDFDIASFPVIAGARLLHLPYDPSKLHVPFLLVRYRVCNGTPNNTACYCVTDPANSLGACETCMFSALVIANKPAPSALAGSNQVMAGWTANCANSTSPLATVLALSIEGLPWDGPFVSVFPTLRRTACYYCPTTFNLLGFLEICIAQSLRWCVPPAECRRVIDNAFDPMHLLFSIIIL
ncbi:hypothetical protein K438DRAFT_1941570 [Mycena galopus ATCC 62051]|nr:hypothetical protein K438DRAFT_1941570 [Mycena galopus ATCC 62051]